MFFALSETTNQKEELNLCEISASDNNSLTKRARTLLAAEKLFSEHGYAGTSIRDIAEEAEVFGSLILHHFKSKRDLWNAVKEAQYDVQNEAPFDEASIPDSKEGLEAIITHFISTRMELFSKHPSLGRFVAWQDLESTSGKNQEKETFHLCTIYTKCFEGLKANGELPSNVSIKNILISLTSLTSPTTYSLIFSSLKTKKAKKEYLDYCTKLFLGGIKEMGK